MALIYQGYFLECPTFRNPRRNRVTFVLGMIAGQLLAYLKIGVLAFGLMAVVWGIVKVIESRGRREIGGRDEPNAD